MDNLQTMRAFAAVVEAGSFTAAAEQLRLTKGVVSKQVSQLEGRLGVRLLNRTTRSVSLTEFGQAYYERVARILTDIEDLESAAQERQTEPRGRLRLTAPQVFGDMFVAPVVRRYLELYPETTVELILADRFVSLVEEGFDLAVRIAEPPDSSLIARKIRPVRHVTCASPAYLGRRGTPHQPRDLRDHDCVIDLNGRTPRTWRYRANGEPLTVNVNGRAAVNSAAAARGMALEGLGIALIPDFIVAADLAAGSLVELFAENHAYDSAVYTIYPHARHLAPKVRRFIDLLNERLKESPDWIARPFCPSPVAPEAQTPPVAAPLQVKAG
ncbi:LysR family transcriptional regulator [Neomegalonema sp.]|uniref:LysR family transcriptional regulator n=1 Tax=Neomegalonema sp. TaxID=2039713 RepID=UPI002604CF8A|nr:LysR family transcriptional regulator [Neomegalonema sp.]MDD2867138.1 LysR substrate-binding domain-containing protein [Neomegalonema sp.]